MSAAPWQPVDPTASTWAELLSSDPIITHTWRTDGFPLGCASVIGPLVKERPAHFLVASAWTIETDESRDFMVNAMRSYLAEFPNHQLTFIGNNNRESNLMKHEGLNAFTMNHNALLNEAVFCPLPGVAPVFDAIYNGRLSIDKRPELAALVERLALLYFYNPYEHTVPEFHAAHARYSALMPLATFVNKLTDDGCEWFPPERVNSMLAQARVGLCLSEAEGAMRASGEYLLAGLSIVSTPSLGGREHYFDDEYCIIADPDPRAIRDAVKQLVERDIPRDYVRGRMLDQVEADRASYIALVQSIIEKAGGHGKFTTEHFMRLIRGKGIMRWRSMAEFSETVLKPSSGHI